MAKAKHKKENSSNQKAEGLQKNAIWQMAFWGLAVLLFLPPYFRGLFFATEQRKVLLFAVIIFMLVCLWKWLRKDYAVLSHPMDYFMLALPVVYIISSFNSINSGLAVDEIVKAVLYFIVYWLVVQLVRSKKDAEIIIGVIYLSAVGVALAGLMTTSGIITINDGFKDGRIASTLQYANGLASYMAAVFTLGVYQWWKLSHLNSEEKGFEIIISKYLTLLIAVGNFLLLAVFLGAKSNGGFIVIGLGLLILLAFLPGINRILVLIHLAIIAVPAAGAIYFFLGSVKNKHMAQAWLWVLGALILTAGLQWLYLKFVPGTLRKEDIQRRLLIGGLVLILIICVVVSFTFTDEIKSLTGKFKDDSLAHRVYFVEDAFNMVKERPVFGWGGGGWQEAYLYFQSYSYVSTQVHSNYIQVAVETGAAGLLMVVGLWGSFLVTLYRTYRKRDKMLATFLGTAALIFGMHAAADFDLSLSALSLVLYSSMAVIRNMDRGALGQELPSAGKESTGKYALALSASAGLVVFLLLIPLLVAQNCSKEADTLFRQGNIGALALMEKAAFYDPLHADYHIALSDMYRAADKLDKSMDEMGQALAGSKYNPDIQARRSYIALLKGDYKDSVKYAEETINMAPWQIKYYENAGSAYKSAGLGEMKNKNLQEADKYFSLAINLPKRIQEKRNSLDSFKQKYSNSLGTTPKIALTAGVGEFLLGNTKEATVNLKRALGDKSTKGEAYVWLSLLSEKQGDPKSAEKNLNEAKKISPQLENSYQELRQLLQ